MIAAGPSYGDTDEEDDEGASGGDLYGGFADAAGPVTLGLLDPVGAPGLPGRFGATNAGSLGPGSRDFGLLPAPAGLVPDYGGLFSPRAGGVGTAAPASAPSPSGAIGAAAPDRSAERALSPGPPPTPDPVRLSNPPPPQGTIDQRALQVLAQRDLDGSVRYDPRVGGLVSTATGAALSPFQTTLFKERALGGNSYPPGVTSPEEAALDWRLPQLSPGSAQKPPKDRPPPPSGEVSMKYETGYPPGQEDRAAATVSTGKKDAGGVSYGAFQLASKTRDVDHFLQSEGAPWAAQLPGDPSEPDGDFARAWKANPPPYAAQYAYMVRTHYDPAVDKVLNRTGVDIDSRGPGVREAVWSMATQHGAAPQLIVDAVNSLRGRVEPTDPAYDRALVNALYDRRAAYVRDTPGIDSKPALYARYKDERQKALSLLPSPAGAAGY